MLCVFWICEFSCSLRFKETINFVICLECFTPSTTYYDQLVLGLLKFIRQSPECYDSWRMRCCAQFWERHCRYDRICRQPAVAFEHFRQSVLCRWPQIRTSWRGFETRCRRFSRADLVRRCSTSWRRSVSTFFPGFQARLRTSRWCWLHRHHRWWYYPPVGQI